MNGLCMAGPNHNLARLWLAKMKYNAGCIFLHGRGSDGKEMKEWLEFLGFSREMERDGIKLVIPTAPERVRASSGVVCVFFSVWGGGGSPGVASVFGS